MEIWTGEEPNLSESGKSYPYTAEELPERYPLSFGPASLTDEKFHRAGFTETDQSCSDS